MIISINVWFMQYDVVDVIVDGLLDVLRVLMRTQGASFEAWLRGDRSGG